MDTILVILFRRPDYTKQVLDALAAQPEIKNYHVHFQIDSCIKEVVDLAVAFDATQKSISINGQQAGCGYNVYLGLENAFSISDFVVVVEDDIVPAHDFLKFMEWSKALLNDECRSISAYHKYEDCPESLYNVVRHGPAICCWGWATTKANWEEAKKIWDWEIERTVWTWDCMVAKLYFNKYKTVLPYLSRSRNVGAENGTYTPNPEQHKREVWIDKWVESVPRELITDLTFSDSIPDIELVIWEDHPLKNTLLCTDTSL